VPAVLRGDQDRLRQVLLNLVNNAVKFTERGEVVVRVGVEDELAEQVTLRIEVRDTGAGIAEELRSLLFQSFSQIDASTTRRFGGTGLGLAISKGLVELMGGTIGVDSAVNQGSIFWCVLPFQKQASGIQVRRVPEELRRLRVLAVDDNATNLEILSEQFNSWGLSLDVADEGLLALEKLRHAADGGRRYDLAILDVHMPGLNGLQLVRAIQQDPSLVDTKLIVLTSMDHSLDRTEMGRLGLSGFIHKPVRQSRLLDAIVDATAKSVIEDRDIHSDQAVPRRASSDTRGKILIAEDNDINQIVVREILEQAGYGCELVSDGQAAAKAALSGQFDVVLMDCQMPVMDGFEAARLIRGCEGESTARRRVPIIALTANAVKGDRERCLEAGMDGYLSKPVDGPALIGAIEALMRQYDRVGGSTDHELLDEMISEDLTLDCAPNATKDETMTRPMAPNNTPPVINFDELLERCVGNLEVARRVMQRFIASGSTQVARLESALSHGDMPAVAASAHLLRGMAANLSAAPLATVCGELEESALRGEREVLAICLSRLKKALPLAQQAGADWLESMQVAAVG
jgi:CheY-like chemotaxis protein